MSFCAIFLPTTPAQAKLLQNTEKKFFPVPVFETRPDEGQTYGLMPVVLFSEKESQAISLILATIGQYNTVVHASGAVALYYYPHPVKNPEEVFDFYFEFAQKVYRETTLHYSNPNLTEHIFVDGSFLWLETPFGRFYGYGPETSSVAESSFTSKNLKSRITFGYFVLPKLRVNLTEQIASTSLSAGIIPDTADTLASFAGTTGVVDNTSLLHSLSLTYDTRPSGMNSQTGVLLEGTYFFAIPGLVSTDTLNGFSLQAIGLLPWKNKKMVSALRFFLQDMFGKDIPFYMQSSLGGPNELRSYVPGRFTDTGKVILSAEHRFHVLSAKVFHVPLQLHIDPFVEFGRVFSHVGDFGFDHWQPVVGIGLRGKVPPNVVARVDAALGREGYSVYTMLGFAF
ncbi:MAG TPA: BamA/TamA family outer membrane protein [bacterium]|nr:BamA/TamA family outer membrane protein [bacterium]